MSGKLYIIPTPIGNLSDMTFRAVEILKKVELIGAEDTRKSSILMKHYQIKTVLKSYHKFNEKKVTPFFVSILNEGKDIAIVSDAGTPGICDPSSIIIQAAIENEIPVITLPGANAFVPAFLNGGFYEPNFCFMGFLPEKKIIYTELLNRINFYPEILIFYEAPHRLFKTLNLFLLFLGNRQISISREISKVYETTYRNDILFFLENPEEITLKGEFVIVIEGASKKEKRKDEDILELLKKEILTGSSHKTAVQKIVTATGEKKNRVYSLVKKIDNFSSI